MVNSRPAPSAPVPTASSSSQSNLNTAYSLALLSEYTHTLDSLPLDLSRTIGDLRELDAVLSSSMISITAKIHELTCMIEERRGSKEERLWLLHEIAEEAARLKYGGDDKIRVACTAADSLKAHSAHLRTLAERMPDFDVALLNRKTVYPHVSDKSFMPLNMDTGRRRRGGAGSSGLLSNANTVDPSPAKRKRFARDEEINIDSIRSPHKKERLLEPSNARSRTNGRVKKPERVPSPSESLVSVTSHLPSQNAHHTNGASSTRGTSAHQNHSSTLASSGTNRNANGSSATNKRRGGANSSNNRVSTPLPNDYPSHNPTSSIPSHRAAGSGLPSSSSNHHPSSSSNLAAYTNGAGVMTNGNAAHYYNNDHPHSLSGTPDLNLSSTQLLGPGVPFARSASVHSTATNANGATGGRNGSASVNTMNSVSADGGTNEAGDVDGDNDDGRTYCYCDGVSYGEMIACDDENCEREWFHLSCIGLTVCPEGSWFCDTCKNKRNNKRSGRGGKRRAAGNRAGGKA